VSERVVVREIRGETLLLHPLRAVLWPARRTAIVADIHFGKGDVFARHGLAVPHGTDALDRERLDALLAESGATRLLVLGDFLHGAITQRSAAARELGAWLGSLGAVRVQVITGNHDRSAAAGWRAPVQWEVEDLIDGPFRFTHEEDAARPAAQFTFSGHVHPVIALGALRKRRLRVPVFWERASGMVLPSFGLFTGGFRLEPAAGERVFVAGPETVVELRVAPRG
jgi:DNA ligase-associated metallophosphoesterase